VQGGHQRTGEEVVHGLQPVYTSIDVHGDPHPHNGGTWTNCGKLRQHGRDQSSSRSTQRVPAELDEPLDQPGVPVNPRRAAESSSIHQHLGPRYSTVGRDAGTHAPSNDRFRRPAHPGTPGCVGVGRGRAQGGPDASYGGADPCR
jgi:hypothetical protein